MVEISPWSDWGTFAVKEICIASHGEELVKVSQRPRGRNFLLSLSLSSLQLLPRGISLPLLLLCLFPSVSLLLGQAAFPDSCHLLPNGFVHLGLGFRQLLLLLFFQLCQVFFILSLHQLQLLRLVKLQLGNLGQQPGNLIFFRHLKAEESRYLFVFDFYVLLSYLLFISFGKMAICRRTKKGKDLLRGKKSKNQILFPAHCLSNTSSPPSIQASKQEFFCSVYCIAFTSFTFKPSGRRDHVH